MVDKIIKFENILKNRSEVLELHSLIKIVTEN